VAPSRRRSTPLPTTRRAEALLDPLVDISEVSKQYGAVTALDRVALRVTPGVTGLLGPNGSGKSTLIKALLGLVRVQAGCGVVLGQAWPQRVRQIRDAVGYLPEDDCYLAGLSGIESAAFMARLSGLPGREALRRSHEIADFCDIGEERYRPVESYSTGMRQKLKFVQALVHDPPLLILDEPTTGLDPDQRRSMLSRIRALAVTHGKAVLLSTHILPDVQAACDQVVILARGRVRVADTLERLSRPAEPTVQLATFGDAARLIARLDAEGKPHRAVGDGAYRIEGIAREEIPQLWRWAAEAEVAVRQLEPARNSLEQIFFDALREEPHAPA
jgi:ABC-2 type transport system ATP-binding protein